jgi:hypothetical protein
MLNIISKLRIFAMFVIVNLRTVFHTGTWCVIDMCMLYLYAIFYVHRSYISLGTTDNKKAEENFFTTAILLFYIRRKYYLQQKCSFSKVYYHVPFQDSKYEALVSFALSRYYCCLQRIKVRLWSCLQWYKVVHNFVKIEEMFHRL